MPTDFSLTEDDINLIVKYIGHGAEADCECFSATELVAGSTLLYKLKGLVDTEDQEAMDEHLRMYGEA